MANGEDDPYLKQLARDIFDLKNMVAKVINYMNDAESEVPEKMRRFVMYYHDVHDIMILYHNQGLEPPNFIKREIERCSDRFRHLVEDQFADTGTFEQVRRDMTQRQGNRYDYSHMLGRPAEEKKQ